MNRLCNHCKQIKPFDEYFKDKSKKDGIRSICKECEKLKEKGLIKFDLGYIPLTNLEKDFIITRYKEGSSQQEIANSLNINKARVQRFIKNIGIARPKVRRRKYKFKNENYFDEINTDDKAYFLGLLWADGCNIIKNEGNRNTYRIQISLQARDGYLLNELAKQIFENENIVKYIDASSQREKGLNRMDQLCLKINSKHISSKLNEYGMIPRKSTTVKMPININWNENLLRGFVRGFLDGDGCITCDKSKKAFQVNFISSIDHMKEMNVLIKQYFGEELYFYIKDKRYNQPMGVLVLGGNRRVKKFLDWLYSESSIHLTRKYEKYQQLNKRLEDLDSR